MTNRRIEMDKEDFVALAVYASCAELPEKENKYEMILRRIMDSLDKDAAVEIAGDILVKTAELELRHGTSREDLIKETAESGWKVEGGD